MSDVGLAGLAALSARVKNERLLLLDRLKSFEKKLVESASGLDCGGASDSVTLDRWVNDEDDISGTRSGCLRFDGTKLTVETEQYVHGWPEPYWETFDLEAVSSEWQLLLSAPETLESLIANISKNLEDDHLAIATSNEWLTKFSAAEKAAIDEDLDKFFEQIPGLLDSWQKARKAVDIDPEDSITRSCSHLETVLKASLKQLGETGYESDPVDKLTVRTVKKLRAAGHLDEGTLEALKGVGTIFHGIGTIRNSSSTAHGKSDGYTPPGTDIAQLINHLAGCVSAFVLKQNEQISKA